MNRLTFEDVLIFEISAIKMGISEDIKQKTFSSEQSKTIINIFYTNSWLSQKHQEIFKNRNLTTPQFNVLRILRGQHPQPATVNLLIERMLDKSSNASRIVDKLESKGLVQRKKCSEDRRAVDVLISKAGLDLLTELDVELARIQKDVLNLNTEECEELNRLLDKLRS